MLLAWADERVGKETIDKLAEPAAAGLTLKFNAVDGGLALGAS